MNTLLTFVPRSSFDRVGQILKLDVHCTPPPKTRRATDLRFPRRLGKRVMVGVSTRLMVSQE